MTTTMTTFLRRAWVSTAIALVTFLLGTAAAAGPSHDLSTYVLFGDHGIRARGFRIDHGDVGVNQGSLTAHDAVDGPDSALAGDVVSVGGRSRCGQLFFTTAVAHSAPSCGPGTSYVGPLVADLPAACGVPDEFPDCSEGSAVDVAAGDERTLAPGVYGDVDVGGAASRHGRLVLTGGRYVFCSLRTRRGAVLEADSAAQVFVAGDVRIGPRSSLGPAEDLEILTQGSRFAISRNAEVGARVCALDGTLHVTDGATLTGRFVAGQVVAGRIALAGLETGPSTTTTSSTSSTTSSTIPTTDQRRAARPPPRPPPTTTSSTYEQQHRPDDDHLQHEHLDQLDRTDHHDHGTAEHDDHDTGRRRQQRVPTTDHLHDHQSTRRPPRPRRRQHDTTTTDRRPHAADDHHDSSTTDHHDHGTADHDDHDLEHVDDEQQRGPHDHHVDHHHDYQLDDDHHAVARFLPRRWTGGRRHHPGARHQHLQLRSGGRDRGRRRIPGVGQHAGHAVPARQRPGGSGHADRAAQRHGRARSTSTTGSRRSSMPTRAVPDSRCARC